MLLFVSKRGAGRIYAADIAKGLGILFVFLGHCHKWPTENLVYSFHMPLFFVLSGWCASFSPDMQSLRTRTARLFIRLYLPILAVLSAECVLDLLRLLRADPYCVNYTDFAFSKAAQCAFLFSVRTELLGTLYESTHVMWFLTALFVGRTLFDFMHLRLVGAWFVAAVGLCTWSGMALGRHGVHLPHGVEAALAAQAYLFTGWLLKRVRLGSVWVLAASFALWLSLAVWIQTGWGGRFSMCDGHYPHMVLSVACALSGSVAVISLSSLVDRWRGAVSSALATLGAYTLELLLVHEFEYLYLAPHYSDSLWVHFAVTVCIVVPPVFILRWLMARRRGGGCASAADQSKTASERPV